MWHMTVRMSGLMLIGLSCCGRYEACCTVIQYIDARVSALTGRQRLVKALSALQAGCLRRGILNAAGFIETFD
jgi:hypothetical protein